MHLRSRYSVKTLILVGFIVLVSLILIEALFNLAGNSLDDKANDLIYKYAFENNQAPKPSKQVVFLSINDNTYDYLKSNQLDRKFLAKSLNLLSEFEPNAIMYDLIFAKPSNRAADSMFAEAIEAAGNVCLPAGFSVSTDKVTGIERDGEYFKRLESEFRFFPKEIGEGKPYYAGRGLVQDDQFAAATATSGHITAVAEGDGVYRTYPMLLKLDSGYIPTSTLAMFCKMNDVEPDSIIVEWGKQILIRANEDNKLLEDVIIPIDIHGLTYIPYAVKWQKDDRKQEMEMRNFNLRAENPELTAQMQNYYEGSVVFIGDVSTGISDSGPNTLEDAVPLVVIHAAIMNALVTNSFYSQFGSLSLILMIAAVVLILTILSLYKKSLYFYIFYGLVMVLALPFTYYLVVDRVIFPMVTFQLNVSVSFLLLLVTVQYTGAKEQSFIKSAFSRYLSPSVVDRLIDNPENLTLGGEERELTVLFSDIEGFTTISERMKPADLVKLLNEYFTKMTGVITANGGIIDKFIGDAIMAEFGAPLPMERHAVAAVRSALQMQNNCDELNKIWKERGYPKIGTRVGINTGPVILGNMGSDQVFDYTVLGDTVNLASRLEGAGKLYGINIMISESVLKQIDDPAIVTRQLDILKVKGKDFSVGVYEVISEKNQNLYAGYYDEYSAALHKYLERDFETAGKLFAKCLELKPGDPASVEFIERVNHYIKNPPSEDWDGSFKMTTK
ncbi:MAG: adenylate/guanylate cyclase domain-containing protein [Ignavibacteriales bacterium]|nr:MAG: adenylate/guanylate cyclase domain-containing protein [Ignavibacteriaceae bacterium]MBW7873133.1 adenylate/guanylate cyclase domain-containing protein [Ignavibacteria bacterium]MCZ2142775.1 adenylate/guanylate cyclase domain-containing protein [Ignavibacteriales bacterium]OQY74482.1 MAG: hypothetical protein B6D45_06850 [Ignavibacteriales bacterium UTCHB3]MBV6443869.1 hypothetical protein [Ignavibacteriaceae bacterium]